MSHAGREPSCQRAIPWSCALIGDGCYLMAGYVRRAIPITPTRVPFINRSLPISLHPVLLARSRQSVVGLSRFELLTPRLSSVCSNQLSYRPSFPDSLKTR
jgi:hypothetical protein